MADMSQPPVEFAIGLNFPAYADDDVRNKLCRALNRYLADSYQGCKTA